MPKVNHVGVVVVVVVVALLFLMMISDTLALKRPLLIVHAAALVEILRHRLVF